MTNPPTTMSLQGTGPRRPADWATLVTALPTATAVWNDIDGIHHESLPTQLPTTATHLWFWTATHHGRVRIDHDLWVCGTLIDPATSPPAELGPTIATNLTVDRLHPKAWGVGDGRVAAVRFADRDCTLAMIGSLTQLIPRRPTTGVFLGPAILVS